MEVRLWLAKTNTKWKFLKDPSLQKVKKKNPFLLFCVIQTSSAISRALFHIPRDVVNDVKDVINPDEQDPNNPHRNYRYNYDIQ